MAKLPVSQSWGTRYQKANGDVIQRIIGASFGEPGSGKTSFWLSAPGPIVIMSLDKGLEGVVEPFTKHKEIYVDEYSFSPATTGAVLDQEAVQEMRDRFEENFYHACAHARTVVWDKETDIYAMFQFAEFGPPREGYPKDWDSLKARLRTMINHPKKLTINFGLIQGMRNEWASKVNPKTGKKGIEQTGERIRSGMEDVEGLVHVNIEHVREKVQLEDGKFQSRFRMNVEKSRGPGSPLVQDQSFYNLDFPTFAQMVFPDSDEGDWI